MNKSQAKSPAKSQADLMTLCDDLAAPPGVPLETICGVDEAGRGPLAGPVVAAAVILDPSRPIPGLADSKALTEARRQDLALAIREQALAWCVAEASVEEIDRLNILQATMLAMRRAVQGLGWDVRLAQVDGNRSPRLACSEQLIVSGDARVARIAAASILAKTVRDAGMLSLHEQYPDYGFERHKGYGTAAHLTALRSLGATVAHRRSFRPVRLALEAAGRWEELVVPPAGLTQRGANQRELGPQESGQPKCGQQELNQPAANADGTYQHASDQQVSLQQASLSLF